MRIAFPQLLLFLLLWPLTAGAQSVTGSSEVPTGIKVGRIVFGLDGSVVTQPAEPLMPPLLAPQTDRDGNSSQAAGSAELRFRRSGEDLISTEGLRYRRIGNTLFGSDGSTFLELGDRVIGSDGHRYRWAGAGTERRLVRETSSGQR